MTAYWVGVAAVVLFFIYMELASIADSLAIIAEAVSK